MQPPSFRNFGIIHGDRGTGDHNIRTDDIRWSVAFESGRAQRRKPLCNRRVSKIGPGNLIPEIQQHLGNTTHADAADAHAMNALNLGKHCEPNPESSYCHPDAMACIVRVHRRSAPFAKVRSAYSGRPSFSTISAISSTALGCANDLAASPMLRKRGTSFNKAPTVSTR